MKKQCDDEDSVCSVFALRSTLLLRKRDVIESVEDILKTVCDLDHSRHRAPLNMPVNTYAALEPKHSIFV